MVSRRPGPTGSLDSNLTPVNMDLVAIDLVAIDLVELHLVEDLVEIHLK